MYAQIRARGANVFTLISLEVECRYDIKMRKKIYKT